MGLETFIIVAIVYAIFGMGTSKALGALNRDMDFWDGGTVTLSFIAWPIALVFCAFWNFKK